MDIDNLLASYGISVPAGNKQGTITAPITAPANMSAQNVQETPKAAPDVGALVTPQEHITWNELKSDKGREAFLESLGYSADRQLKPDNPSNPFKGQWAIYDPTQNTIHPLKAKGDIGASLAGAVPMAAKTIMGTAGMMAGGIPGAALAGMGEEAGEEALTHKYEEANPYRIMGEGAVNAAGAALPEVAGVAKGLLGKRSEAAGQIVKQAIGGKILQKLTPAADKQVSEIIDKTIGTEADKMVQQGGKSVRLGDLIKSNLKYKTLEDLTDPEINSQIAAGTKNSMEEVTQTAADAVRNAKESVPKIESKIYKDAGISDTEDMVPVGKMKAYYDAGGNPVASYTNGSMLGNASNKIDEFAKTAVTDDDQKLLIAAKNTLAKIESQAVDGKLNFGQAKQWTNKLYDLRDAYLGDDGRNTPMSKMFKGIADELTKAKNSIPKVGEAAKKVTALRDNEEDLNMLMRLKTSLGDNRLYTKIQNLMNNPDLVKKFEGVKAVYAKIPETESIAKDLKKVNVAMVNDDLAKAKPPSTGILSHVPFVNKLLPMGAKPDSEAQGLFLKRLAVNGNLTKEKLAQRIPVGDTPYVSSLVAQIRAKAALYGKQYVPPDLTNMKLGLNNTPLMNVSMPNIAPAVEQLGVQTIKNLALPKQSTPNMTAPAKDIKIKLPEGNISINDIKKLIPKNAKISNLNQKIMELAGLDKT